MSRLLTILLASLLLLLTPGYACGLGLAGSSRAATETRSGKGASSQKKSTKNGSGKKSAGKKSSGKKSAGKKKSSASGKAAGSNRSEKDVRRDKSRAETDIKETRRQIKANAEETSRKLSQLNLVEGEIEECNSRIGVISTRLDSINGRISTLNDSISALDTHLRQITATYIKAIKRSQGRRQQMSALAFIFSSDSFAQAYRRARYLRQFARWREKRAGEISAAKEVLDAKRRRLSSLADAAAKSKNELSREHASLVKKQTETANLVGELREQGAALKEVMAEQRARATALERELENVIAREAARREAQRKAAEAERARKAAEAEAARKAAAEEAARKAAAEEAARKAREAAAAEEAKRVAAEEAARKEAEAEAARKEAEKARKEARREEQRREAERKAAEAEAAKKAAKEAKEAARKAEAEAKRAEAERKAAEEKKRREEKRAKTKPVRHDQKGSAPGAGAPAGAGQEAATLHTPDHSSEGGTAPKGIEAGADFASLKGALPFPITGRYTIVKRFGRQQHPSLPHVVTDNAGIDLETAKGASVRSVCDGEVSAVFRPNGYNSVVVIRHGTYMTVYANLATVSVTTGQKVKAGQNIGSVFSDPKDNGRSVLHFEVRNGRQKENPEAWLRR